MCDKCKKELEENARMEAERSDAVDKRNKKVSLRIDIIFAFVNLVLGFFIAWGLSRIFDSKTESIWYDYYYAFVIFLPFAWRTVSSIIPSNGCLSLLLNIFLSILLGPIFYFVGVWKMSRGIRKAINGKWGIVLEIVFIIANITLAAFLYLLLVGLRMDFLETKYPGMQF